MNRATAVYVKPLRLVALVLTTLLFSLFLAAGIAEAAFRLEYVDGVENTDGMRVVQVHPLVDMKPTLASLEKGRKIAQERAEAARRAAAARVRVSSGGACYAEPGTPPATVLRRESGGNPKARNPSGAAGCWQFMPGTWGGYKGYASADQAPVSVQNERAKQVWAGGKGASHWRATCC